MPNPLAITDRLISFYPASLILDPLPTPPHHSRFPSPQRMFLYQHHPNCHERPDERPFPPRHSLRQRLLLRKVSNECACEGEQNSPPQSSSAGDEPRGGRGQERHVPSNSMPMQATGPPPSPPPPFANALVPPAGARATPSSLISGAVRKEAAIATHANLHGVSTEKWDAIRRLYDRLDMDNDGTIDIRDLTVALQHEVPHIPREMAPQILEKISTQEGGEKIINFNEFVGFVVEQERKLESLFKVLDKNKDGYIDHGELRDYCRTLAPDRPISDEKVDSIVKQMDRSGRASVENFLDYMRLYPSSDPHEIVDFWRHNLMIDIGEDCQLPEDFSATEIATGVWWRHLVAGGIAGCTSRTCTAPLDRLKVFLQVHSNRHTPFSLRSGFDYLKKEGGFRSFWRGNGVNVMKIAPESALKFAFYEQIKRFIQKLKGSSDLTIYERFLAGASAGAIAQTIIYPMEVLKTRLALRKTGELPHGLSHFASEMYRREGLVCFYRGYIPNLIGIIPYAGIDLAIYETLKRAYVRRHPNQAEPGVPALLLCGTLSSTAGQLTSYPFALVRTRLQARRIADLSQPDSMRGQLYHIYSNEGLRGLYRGITPNFLKVIPAVSISYVVYEWTRKRLGATMS